MELNTCRTCNRVTEKRRVLLRLPPDTLTSLPDELLGRILSLLQTKDVVATQVLSKRMGRPLSLVTSVDLDAPCLHVERLPRFKSFLVNVMHNLSEVGKGLTRFRLCLGDENDRLFWRPNLIHHLPDMEHSLLNALISYPLAHNCLRELDLTFHIKNPKEYKLPRKLFEYRSLVSFKFNANISIDGTDIPLITRLISSCPALEELYLHCAWEKLDRIAISSHSLRRLTLCVFKPYDYIVKITDRVVIDTPNLHYFHFNHKIPIQYSVSHMNALVKAKLIIDDNTHFFPIQLSSLLSAVSDVQHLFLHGYLEVISLAPKLDPLPVFRNLRTLKLYRDKISSFRWDIMLPFILRSSPLLETLVFPMGLHARRFLSRSDEAEKRAETKGWRTIQTLPSCFPTHFKRLEIANCYGREHDEWNLIRYVLGKASALEELVICLTSNSCDFEKFVTKLEQLPRASNSCSITVDQ